MSLRKKLADNGFESNDDYEYPLRCLFEADLPHLRCLNLTGVAGRRKTAFADALARALEYPHIVYHDCSADEPPAPPIVLSEDAEQAAQPEAPLSAFDRAVTEACAYSEGARTVLIIDQLQAADFRDHVRLYQLTQSREWNSAQGTVVAHLRNLLVVLISEEPLYHSLARISFRIHTDASRAYLGYRPADFGLDPAAEDFMAALAQVFEAIQAAPTASEYAHILADVLARVRTADQLRLSLFGWMENLDRAALYALPIAPLLEAAVAAVNRYLGIEEIEMGDD